MYELLQCPNCGSAMEDRGQGRHLCNSCQFEFDENQPEEDEVVEEVKPSYSGPGFKEPWVPKATAAPADSGESPGTMAPPKDAPSPMGSLYTPGDVLNADQGDGPRYPTLETEKNYYYMISLILLIISCIGVLFLGLMSGVGGFLRAIFGVAMNALFGAIYLAILRYFLFETPSWGKWGCLIYQVVTIIGPIIALFTKTALKLGRFNLQDVSQSMLYMGVSVVGSVIGIGFSIWLITILWRDIQLFRSEQGRGPEFYG